MAKVTYVGPGPDALEVAQAGVTVRLGETVEVPDEVAQALLERPDFEPADSKSKAKEG